MLLLWLSHHMWLWKPSHRSCSQLSYSFAILSRLNQKIVFLFVTISGHLRSLHRELSGLAALVLRLLNYVTRPSQWSISHAHRYSGLVRTLDDGRP